MIRKRQEPAWLTPHVRTDAGPLSVSLLTVRFRVEPPG
jgi:hypothetical protein